MRQALAVALILGGSVLGTGCGAGDSLIGHEDASVVLRYDGGLALQRPSDAGDVGPVGHKPPATIASTTPSDCRDQDGDGFGFGNACRGADCDDQTPSVTDQCYRCREPLADCPCEADAAPVPCDLTTGRNANPNGVCNLGQRTCTAGRWGACEAWRQPFQYQGPVSACPGSCLPGCRHQVLCPAPGDVMPGGSSGVRLGGATQAVFCPTGTPRGGVTGECAVVSGQSYSRGPSPLSYQDICNAPGHSRWLANTDDSTFSLSLPFAFDFYGAPHTQVGVSTNGMISFGAASPEYFNYALPYPTIADTLFAFWDDLHTRAQGVCTVVRGLAPTRQLVVQWSNARFYGADAPETSLNFQAVLAETRNTLDVLYGTMVGEGSRATGSSATIGLQQGSGSSYDQVAYNVDGAVGTGASIRWTPANGRTQCNEAVYRRVFDGQCNNGESPHWGQFNYTAVVPAGTRIALEVRLANDLTELTTAPPVRLPDAPPGTTAAPVSIDLGATVRAAMPGVALDGRRYLQLTAVLVPSADGTESPTLVSTQTQFVCAPNDPFALCRAGVDCYLPALCRRGVITCTNSTGGRPIERCVDVGAAPAGTACGDGRVCNANGSCIPCNEGAACDLMNVCASGRITCASGEPTCVAGSYATAGTICRGDANSYHRGPSPLAWVDACTTAGHSRLLTTTDDGMTAVGLPFPFVFYGIPRAQAWASNNGTLSFSADAHLWRYINSTLPVADLPDTIFAFWDDLAPRSRGVCVATLGTAPTRQLVVQWDDAFFFGQDVPGTSLSFETILAETSNTLDVLYRTMRGEGDRALGASATVGIQRDHGGRFDLVGYNTPGTVGPGRSIRWTPTIQAVCDGAGACVTCEAGAPCDTGDPCGIGNVICTGSVPSCIRVGTQSPGSVCGNDRVCSPAGACVACQEDAACDTGDPCAIGATRCGSGVPTCVAVGVRPPGTVCGPAQVCSPAGACIACDAGAACPASQPCGTARIVCSTGAPVCLDVTPPTAIQCNGVCVTPVTYFADRDGDGFGALSAALTGCPGAPPPGYVTLSGDCNDSNPYVYPGATERCNGVDDNCNNLVDELWPGLGAACTRGLGVCATTGQYVCNSTGDGTRCSAAVIAPTTESCNNLDDNCDGTVDNVAASLCQIGDCQYGYRACTAGGEVCVPAGNRNEGGACGSPVGGTCRAGTCGCNPSTELNCGGVCLPAGPCLSTGSGTCREAGTWVCSGTSRVCSATPRTSGACTAPTGGTCDGAGFCSCPGAVCNGACTDLGSNVNHCGACGNACQSGQNCIQGACVGSGELQFALTWDRNNDVDLHVRPPCGTEIFYANLSACGGYLDRDDVLYRGPENIYWTNGNAPANGWHEVCVTPYYLHGGPTYFTLRVFRNGVQVATRTGYRSTSSGNRSCAYGSTDWVMSYNPVTGATR